MDAQHHNIRVTFDGELLQGHILPIRVLLDILKSWQGLIEKSHVILGRNSKESLPDIQVRAPMPGSFLLDYVIPVVASNPDGFVRTVESLCDLLRILKRLFGESPAESPSDYNDRIMRVTPDHVDLPVVGIEHMLHNKTLVIKTGDTLACITDNPEIAKMTILTGHSSKNEPVTFTDSESVNILKSIDAKHGTNFMASRNPAEKCYAGRDCTVLVASFHSPEKWRFAIDGIGERSVKIEDGEFLRKIAVKDESFTRGDVLKCDIKETCKTTKKGRVCTYAATKVRRLEAT